MTYLKCQCSPYHQHTALYPLVDLVQRLLRYDSPVSSEALLARVEDLLQAQGLHTPEHVTLLASLLTVALSSMPEPSSQLSPLQQRQRTLELLLALLLTMARAQPVLFVIEDVHWIDPSTLEWLGLLMDQGPTTRILTLLICRPTFQVPWGGRDHVTPLTLNPLPASQAAHMVRTMVGAHSLPAALLEQIVAHTDGVPLFVEEVTKFVLASRQLHGPAEDPLSDAPVALTIPTTLHDSLMARLDQMGAAKGTAQLAATIGREWSFALLRAVATTEENTLRQDLRRLVDAELLYQRGVGDQATYVFRHALIQEAAARSLLRRTRQHYHHWIAQALETQFADVATGQPELVAHHYTKAGLLAQALPYWQRAGQRAVERSAHAEAIAHLSRGLAWLATLPETPERAQQELSLYLILGPALMATKGWASAEVEHAYTTALARCQQLGDTPQRLHILMGFAFVHVVRANLAQTQILGEQLLTLAQRHQDPVGLVGAALHLGGAAFGRGEFVQARRYFDQPHSDYNTRHHPAPIVLGGADAGVFCLAWGSHALWLLGYAEQACTQSTATQSRAQELAHPLSQAIALAYAAMLQQFLRNETTVLTLAEAAKTLCMDHGFRYYLAWSTILQGWGLLRQGHGEAGMTQMRQGMDALQATGARRSWAYYGALMAEAYGRSGEPEEGLRLLGEAFAHVQHTGECWWEAELYRLKGALLQRTQSPHPTGETPEAFFRQALAVARRQQAKGLELRAAISLSRLWQQQGKHTEARELLAPLYGWFSEGLDTVDLQEAQALLEVLNR